VNDENPLPRIDEHSIDVKAPAPETWRALEKVIESSFSAPATARFARLLGCKDVAASGPRPLATGSSVPGFHVCSAESLQTLALAGSHRFSSYALVFRLDQAGDGLTTLRAETRATFPGVKGSAYRALVIGTRIHVLVTRRLLAASKQRAERQRSP
jgi:hypothetical protein